MAIEIERKFIAKSCDDVIKKAIKVTKIQQGYLSTTAERTVRVRITDDKAFLTIKSKNIGAVRNEWEYEIPVEDALAMLALPGVKKLSKTRYVVIAKDGRIWEVDYFHDDLSGLILAEIELEDENENFALPSFVEREVTGDKQYFNSNLVLYGMPR